MKWLRYAPLLLGTVAIFVLAAMLAYEDPNPGALSGAHAALVDGNRLPECALCHGEDGLPLGCLGCHVEIGSQLTLKRGYHFALLEGEPPTCEGCHPEHNGESFDLTGPIAWGREGKEGFDHPHVDFELVQAHEPLACEKCHTGEPFHLPAFPDHPREESYLGLDQTCRSCHENVHQADRYATCTECHDQSAFKPASRFDHAPYFKLVGEHANARCAACHAKRETDDGGLPFGEARGTTCAQCHENPHRPDWSETCLDCHLAEDADWRRAAERTSTEQHAVSGFRLLPPHDGVACNSCHRPAPTFEERFRPESPLTEDSCASCHEDVHRGQFAQQNCLECHHRDRFQPHHFVGEKHPRAPLAGAHAKVECNACHRADPELNARRFRGTASSCRVCHEDPHAGQFEARDCDACHDANRFQPPRYGLDQHDGFALRGAHRAVACNACHSAAPEDGVRRFLPTPRRCRDCHNDPHGGQFAAELKTGDCTACHVEDASTFRIRPFDHRKTTGYALLGGHAKAECTACHVAPSKKSSVRFRNTPQTCASCHDDAHRGQFRTAGTIQCDRCHASFKEWTADRFDHQTMSRFRLDGTHSKVKCAACHLPAVQPDGAAIPQYKPLGIECRSCHDFEKR